jgi:hypothetical protein
VVHGGISPLQDIVLISFLILENHNANAGGAVMLYRDRRTTSRLKPVCGLIRPSRLSKTKQWPALTGTNSLFFALTFGPLPFPTSLK